MSGPPPTCDPVWQYVLVMVRQIEGVAKGVRDVGINWDEATLEENAEFLKKFLPKWRELVEKSTDWKEGDYKPKP